MSRYGDIANFLDDLDLITKQFLQDKSYIQFTKAFLELDQDLNVINKDDREFIRKTIRDYYSTYLTDKEMEAMRIEQENMGKQAIYDPPKSDIKEEPCCSYTEFPSKSGGKND